METLQNANREKLARISTGAPTVVRFFQSFEENVTTGCWEWKRTKNPAGYGLIYDEGKQRLAHRVSFKLFNQDLGELCGCHACDNPGCVNPLHIFAGTRADNYRDAREKGRPAPAPRGERSSKAKLKSGDIPVIKDLRASGLTYRAIAARFGVYHSAIIKVCKDLSWKHLSN